MKIAKRFLQIVLATSVIVPVSLVLSVLMGRYVKTIESILSLLQIQEDPAYLGYLWGRNVFVTCGVAAYLSGLTLIHLYTEHGRKRFHERAAR